VRNAIRSLSKNVAIYGAGDVAVSVVSFLLLPIYIRHLTKDDYGALALLGGIEALSKIVFRWGLDGAFMRYYLDRGEHAGLQRLASTLAIFLAVVSGLIVVAALALSPVLCRTMFGDQRYLLPLRIVLVNTFLLTFTFLPFHTMRMRGQAVTFAAFSFARSTATVILRLVLVVAAGWGLLGLMAADIFVTVGLMLVLLPWFRFLLRPTFSFDDLAAALRFGAPRLPHGLAQQALDAGNKFLLRSYVPLSGLGVYQIGTTLGQSLKFFLSAFETGWAPFYYETAARQRDARVTFSKMTTYGIAILALLVAGATAVASDLIPLLANRSYQGAALVVPLIALGVAWQGVYLLTSIGLNLTSQTKYYPISAFAAAAVGLGSGVVLMPRYHAVGAAIAFLLSYVTLAGVAGYFASRHYHIAYEKGRIGRVVASAGIACATALTLPPARPIVGFLLRGSTTVAVFAALLWVGGFFRPTERAFLADLIARIKKTRPARRADALASNGR
jgi:O-antigen/teichoic acid export membrane protein